MKNDEFIGFSYFLYGTGLDDIARVIVNLQPG